MATETFSATSSSSASPSDCQYGLTLTQEISTYDVAGRPQAWRMRVTASDAYNMTPNIFMYLRKESPVEGQQAVDTFEAVASPVDMEEYPAGDPTPGASPAFYRLASIDLLSRNRELLDITWENIKQDVEELVLTMANICELQAEESVRIGYEPTEEINVPDETVPEPGSISEPEACPVDAVASIAVEVSNDPNFPVSALLTPSGATGEPPECLRTWLLVGAVDGKTLKLETSTTLHTFTAYIDDVEVDSGGLADGYMAIIYYEKAPGDERSLEIAAS